MVDHYIVWIRDRETGKRFLFVGYFPTIEEATENGSKWKEAGDVEIVPADYSKSKYQPIN